MTKEELDEHRELREQLASAREALISLREAAGPHAAAMTGMPHGTGVKDNVGFFGAEIVDVSAQIEYLEEAVAESEKKIMPWIKSIPDIQVMLAYKMRYIHCLSWKEVAKAVGGRNSDDGIRLRCKRYMESQA